MYLTENPDVPCKNHDPELWFSKLGSHRTARAKELCGTCPEQILCLSSTMRFEKRTGHTQPGVFGGLDQTERTALRYGVLPVTAVSA